MNAHSSMMKASRRAILAGLALGIAGCTVGPNYHRPAMTTPADFKEKAGWKPAAPAEAESNQPWWAMYHDDLLDQLERKVEVSNQNLKMAEAQYRSARAEVGISRAALLPTVNLDASAQRSNRGAALAGGSGTTSSAGGTTTGTGSNTTANGGGNGTVYAIAGEASWDVDVWGRIRRTVESDVATAQASAADLAAAKLSAQTALAEDYFQMRAAEAQQQLLAKAASDFSEALQIAKNKLAAGVATEADVATADTQLDTTTTQEIAASLTRAKLEHAIALLIGKTPADLTIPLAEQAPHEVPVVPTDIPSTLLERRPDISGAERRAAAANAQIGVAIAAWFPDISLTGSDGFVSSALGTLFTASTASWSYGAAVAETIFDGGARSAKVTQARANYDVAVAQYRQTALAAFQQVEDDLASLRILEQEAAAADRAVTDARRSEQLTLNQYKTGVADYTAVVTAQTNRLNAEVSALNVLSQRITASVDLVDALGGGWNDTQLPKPGFFYRLPGTTGTTP